MSFWLFNLCSFRLQFLLRSRSSSWVRCMNSCWSGELVPLQLWIPTPPLIWSDTLLELESMGSCRRRGWPQCSLCQKTWPECTGTISQLLWCIWTTTWLDPATVSRLSESYYRATLGYIQSVFCHGRCYVSCFTDEVKWSFSMLYSVQILFYMNDCLLPLKFQTYNPSFLLGEKVSCQHFYFCQYSCLCLAQTIHLCLFFLFTLC